ncbi:MAG: methionyl-tRNA formyltransferase [Proteobacteria bacterium]|nr:MAG: methionyl-tRNA formyltransferase [Pseudomonadota bacterium]
MRLEGVSLLAAPTARSQAYLQALVANHLFPENVITMDTAVPSDHADRPNDSSWNGIVLPRLDEPLAATCDRAGIPLVRCAARDVNATEAMTAIRELAPKIVIYSGYGGQIIGDDMLDCSQFLHVHSGWLPAYRGSTTLYYALLMGEDPGVTALILDRNIDTGPIVARRRYPKPRRGMDVDRVYDSAIRADLLVRVMSSYASEGCLPSVGRQTPDEGITYYVIHPVLKHLAILSLEVDAR